MAELSEQSAQVHGLAIAETRDVRNIVGRHQGSELDLNELRRRVLEFELGLRGEETPVALAERRDRFRGELLLALQADAGAFGEAEDVFGLDLAKRAVVVSYACACRALATWSAEANATTRDKRAASRARQ